MSYFDTPGVKRGVSLYSYQQAYYLRELTLEQCIAEAAKIGAFGIESLAEQMMPGFPDLPDSFYDQWHGWMEQYGTYPTSHVMMLELKRWPGRLLDDDEQLENMIRDIRHAGRLGCEIVRVQVFTPAELIERSIPYAAEHGVKLAVEIHTPYHFHERSFVEKYEMFERHGPEWVGFMPDMGAYCRRFPRVIAERFIRDGATEKHIRYIVSTYDDAYATATDLVDLSWLPDEIERRGGSERDVQAARTMTRFFHYTDPNHLRDFMPYIHHVHAKFYEMTDEGIEYSIPYDEIVPILVEGGYRGHLSSEYEGQRSIQDAFPVDEVDQVRRQHELFERILAQVQV
jgi:sugar phosphate isomerase/epimerase